MKKLLLSIIMFFFGKKIKKWEAQYPNESTPLNKELSLMGQATKNMTRQKKNSHNALRTRKNLNRVRKK